MQVILLMYIHFMTRCFASVSEVYEFQILVLMLYASALLNAMASNFEAANECLLLWEGEKKSILIQYPTIFFEKFILILLFLMDLNKYKKKNL